MIICEGASEWTYLQRLQSFLHGLPLEHGTFEPPLSLICPERVVVETGTFGKLTSKFNKTRRENKKASIQIWTDFDLYHRNDKRCANLYAKKPAGIPDFHFSYHNFEDFFALHWEGDQFKKWLKFGAQGHFTTPLHSSDYLPKIEEIFPEYKKGRLPADFISWDTLKNLKRNQIHIPKSNPGNLQGLGCFAGFLIAELERAYPGQLDLP